MSRPDDGLPRGLDDHARLHPAGVLPADCEGELRDIARIMRESGDAELSDALVSIIDRYSGVRPMRTGCGK